MNTIPSINEVEARIDAIHSRFSSPSVGSQASGSEFQSLLDSAISGSAGGVLGNTRGAKLTSLLVQPDGQSRLGSTTGSTAVAAAKKYLGVPYVWGGNDPRVGLDCSSLVQRAFADIGVSLPRVAADQARKGTPVASLAQAKPGDLVAFGSPVDHIGIYVGDNKMIVAPRRGDVVKIQEVYKTPTAIRRIIPDNRMEAALGVQVASSNSRALPANLQSVYSAQFAAAEQKYGLPVNLLSAVAKQESGFNPNARSSAGALGLMQFMPGTAKGLGINPMDPAQAIDGAGRLLHDLTTKFGSTALALAAYNAGPGAVQRYGGIPPYKETQNYVKNILSMTGMHN